MAPMISALPCSSSVIDDDCDQEQEQQSSFRGGILDVRIHDAQGIHNICIYDKQDVFAKLSFTHGKAEPFCTQVIVKGGRNPVFNESFQLPVTVPNSVLKCEMWMSSRAHSYLEDQLLGFVLVPVSNLASKDHHQEHYPEEYGLSSTELFHSPAGIVRLTLVFQEGSLVADVSAGEHSQSSSPEVKKKKKKHNFIKVFEDGHGSYTTSSGSDSPPWNLESDEFERIEFPDLQAASEDQQLVSNYLEMSSSSSQHSVVGSGIITGPSVLFESKEDSNSGGGGPRKSISPSTSGGATICSEGRESEENSASSECAAQMKNSGVQEDGGSMTEDSTLMKKQIVDMYMKSMQQFTEALAKMQLPLDMDHKASTPNAKKSKSHRDSGDNGKKKATGHRVFYGSRAFF